MKTVFISGVFNVLHPGHIRIFRFAKQCGTKLIVGVESDLIAGERAHIRESDRIDGVKSNSYVDEVILITTSVTKVIESLKPAIVVKGKEHETRNNEEAVVIKKYGGELIFSSGQSYLSSELLIRELDFKSNGFIKPEKYLIRHKITVQKLNSLIENLKKLRVCVLGDLIIDEYINCQAIGMSQEEPSLVVSPLNSSRYVGGSGIVALHAKTIGASVNYISVAGNDNSKLYAEKIFNKEKLQHHIIVDSNRPTTLKQRFRCNGKSLLKVSHLSNENISIEIQNIIFEKFKSVVSDIDLVVFSDFNYGCLPEDLVKRIINYSKKHKLVIAADSQSSSQIGDIGKYKGINLITPTEREARVSTKNSSDGIVVLAEELYKLNKVKSIIMTLGAEGAIIHTRRKNNTKIWSDDLLPALNPACIDASGAGDSLLIVSSMVLAAGGSIWEAAYLGSIASGIQVSRVGNIPIKMTELKQKI